METQTTEKKCCDVASLKHSDCIQKALVFVLVLLAVFLFAVTLKAFKEYRYVGSPEPFVNSITVSGEGEKLIVPDTGEFTFGVLEEAKTPGDVQTAVTKKANEVVQALKEKGVEEKDIKTSGYDLYPKYEWTANSACMQFPCEKNQKQVGFELNQSITVKVRDLTKVGEMLEIVASKGVSNVSGLTLTVADEDAVLAEVRKLAIDEAREKAEKIEEDLGVKLVRIIGFFEGGGDASPVMYRDMASSAYGMGEAKMVSEAAVIPAGENRFTSHVEITYEIK